MPAKSSMTVNKKYFEMFAIEFVWPRNHPAHIFELSAKGWQKIQNTLMDRHLAQLKTVSLLTNFVSSGF